MSESTIKIEFIFTKKVKSKIREIEDKFNTIILQCNPQAEIEYSYKVNSARYFASFCKIDSSDINQLIIDLESYGALNIIVLIENDKSDSKKYFCRISGQIHEFESERELKEYEKHIKSSHPQISYSRNGNYNTMIVRLFVKNSIKRKSIFELFKMALDQKNSTNQNNFMERFGKLTKSETHDVEWCKFKWKEKNKWFQIGPCDPISGLINVIESGDYLLIIFDTLALDPKGTYLPDDDIYFVFYSLDGVTKIWIKCRKRQIFSTEYYLFYPGMGDESYFIERDIMDEDFWPK